ncbi:hypothetical protein FS749_001009 [Ceratobasidium sp. UAMH 11750]|nr:hypothetical protein FS749_001009 [Ceratobasidium sp. UAMH 11750]
MKINADLVVIIVSLPSLATRGKDIFNTIKSQLGSFEMAVSCYEIDLPLTLSSSDIRTILSSEFKYHLAFLFLTESSPNGGWWFEDASMAHPSVRDQPAEPHQDSEGRWLSLILKPYTDIAKRAVSARVFGLCCGINLTAPGVVQDIAGCLDDSKWDSIILPTASSVTPEEYACFFPELFMQLYYNTSPLKTALLNTWSKSNRARTHSDLLVIEHPSDPTKRTVHKYSYAPSASRPWGIDTPLACSFCNCQEDDSQLTWVRSRERRSRAKVFGEYFTTLHSSCKHTVLYLAVFAKDFKLIRISGTKVAVQVYSEELRCFPLDNHERFLFKVAKYDLNLKGRGKTHERYPPSQMSKQGRRSKQSKNAEYYSGGRLRLPFEHSSAWTVAGRRAQEHANAGPSSNGSTA